MMNLNLNTSVVLTPRMLRVLHWFTFLFFPSQYLVTTQHKHKNKIQTLLSRFQGLVVVVLSVTIPMDGHVALANNLIFEAVTVSTWAQNHGSVVSIL